MKRVVIVHGWGDNPESAWFQWLKKELESMGVDVLIPTMPDSDNPSKNAWTDHLTEVVGKPDGDTFFVGHSLGCITIIRYLESLNSNVKIGGAVFVAAFAQSIGYEKPDSFVSPSVDFGKVLRHAEGRIVMIHSDNDRYISNKIAQSLSRNLNCELITIYDAGHFTAKDGYTQFPEVMEELNKLI